MAAAGHPARLLTRRQREVAALVARGYTNPQIANELVLTSGSVANHVQRILRRLQVDSRAQIAAWALEHGLGTTQDRLLTTLERMLEIDPTSLVGALQGVAKLLVEALSADSVQVFLYDAAADALVAAGPANTPTVRLPLASGGQIVETFLSGEPAYGEAADHLPGVGVRSAVWVPLEVGDQTRGVLVASSRTPHSFAERDLRFLVAVARWVGAVAHRAELVERATASAVEAARAAITQDVVTTLAEDVQRRTRPLARQVALARGRIQHVGVARDLLASQALARGVRDLGRLADDLLDVVRLERGAFDLRLGPVELGALARDAAAPFRSATRDIRVRAATEVVVWADPARVRQALEHVLADAARRPPDGSPLVIEVWDEQRPDGLWGIVRVGAFIQDVHGVTTVGLRLASRIAEAHGGTLRTARPDDDTMHFTLALPARGPANT
jgi:two-component system, OmpR family, sensor kinase